MILMFAVGGFAIWYSCILFNNQWIKAKDHNIPSTSAPPIEERIPAKRGLITDCKDNPLTGNLQNVEVVADRVHLRDPRTITWGLAFSKACHSDGWLDLSDEDKSRRVSLYQRRLLSQAAADSEPKDKATIFANILIDQDSEAPATESSAEKLRKLYNPDTVALYARKHDLYIAQILASVLEGVTQEQIINIIEQPGALPAQEVEALKSKFDKEGIPADQRPTLKTIQQHIVLAKNVPEEKAEQIKDALQKANIQGIKCIPSMKRVYIAPQLLTHVMGYVSERADDASILEARSGIEKSYDHYLQGTDGIREVYKDKRGRIIPHNDTRFLPPRAGNNVKLTINMDIQSAVEEELDAGLAHNRAPRGTIIVIEPKTGNILALANRPSFNLNTKKNADKGELNYAVQGIYEPGSTFKVIAVTAALDTGKIGYNTIINCSPIPVPGANPVVDSHGSYGALPTWGVLKKSSNPGAYNIGRRVGWNVLKQYITAYGFGAKTGIPLPSEQKGILSDGNNIVNFSRMTYGYSLNVTPLQIVMAYATIANNGVRMRPRLVEAIYSSEAIRSPDDIASHIEDCKPVVIGRVMKESTAKTIRQALATVTEEGGTATKAAIPGFRVGGKTGTAHKTKEGGRGGYYENRYTVSFVGMLPIENPAFVCLVVIDDPRPTDCHPGGGTVAAPIFNKVATRIIKILKLQQSSNTPTTINSSTHQ